MNFGTSPGVVRRFILTQLDGTASPSREFTGRERMEKAMVRRLR